MKSHLLFQGLLAQHSNQRISSAKFAALSFLILGQAQNSKDFIQSSLLRRDLVDLLGEKDEHLAEYFAETKFKRVRNKVNLSLSNWLSGQWPLFLFYYAPSVYDVLRLQAQGQRCATVFTEVSTWDTPKAGKANAFEFLVHDLEHAHQFFGSFHQEQTELYQALLHLYEEGYFEALLSSPLKQRVEYLLSDMNTHPAHALGYLKAIWTEYALQKRVCSPGDFTQMKMKELSRNSRTYESLLGTGD